MMREILWSTSKSAGTSSHQLPDRDNSMLLDVCSPHSLSVHMRTWARRAAPVWGWWPNPGTPEHTQDSRDHCSDVVLPTCRAHTARWPIMSPAQTAPNLGGRYVCRSCHPTSRLDLSSHTLFPLPNLRPFFMEHSTPPWHGGGFQNLSKFLYFQTDWSPNPGISLRAPLAVAVWVQPLSCTVITAKEGDERKRESTLMQLLSWRAQLTNTQRYWCLVQVLLTSLMLATPVLRFWEVLAWPLFPQSSS